MEVVGYILSLNNIYKPKMFAIEDGQISKSLLPYLKEAMLKRSEIVPLKIVKTVQDKVTRAQSIQARMRIGGVKFDKEAEWYMSFEDELMKFPRDKHDDQVDAFAHLGSIVDKMWEAPTDKEEADEEYEEFKRDYQADDGRSLTCGY